MAGLGKASEVIGSLVHLLHEGCLCIDKPVHLEDTVQFCDHDMRLKHMLQDRLDPGAIEQISIDVWPAPRDADELHDALLTFVILPPVSEWEVWFEELKATGRASLYHNGQAGFWIATERTGLVSDTLTIVRGWMECLGPITASALAARLSMNVDEIHAALAALEAEGQVFQGRYRATEGEVEWCNRRILARIHRATLGKLRREIRADFPACEQLLGPGRANTSFMPLPGCRGATGVHCML